APPMTAASHAATQHPWLPRAPERRLPATTTAHRACRSSEWRILHFIIATLYPSVSGGQPACPPSRLARTRGLPHRPPNRQLDQRGSHVGASLNRPPSAKPMP